MNSTSFPYLEIVEQPSDTRFRYPNDKNHGYLYGASSTEMIKKYPKIKIQNLNQNACLVISLITENKPYWPHPYGLHVKESYMDENIMIHEGVCYVLITPKKPEFELKKMRIRCVTGKEIMSLKKKFRNGLDFKAGYGHCDNLKDMNLTAVRLAFSCVLITDDNKPIFWLAPIFSDTIKNKQTKTRLNIRKLSVSSASVLGKTEILMFTDEMNIKNPPTVRFFELDVTGKVTWENNLQCDSIHIHYKYGLAFKTPRYYDLNIEEPRKVLIQLVGAKKNEFSEPQEFLYIPEIKRRRRKLGNSYRTDNLIGETPEMKKIKPEIKLINISDSDMSKAIIDDSLLESIHNEQSNYFPDLGGDLVHQILSNL